MRKLLLSLALALVSTAAVAAPSAKFVYRTNSGNGQPSLVVTGRDLYDSSVFRLRVTDRLTGDSGWYTSNSGKTQWDVQNGKLNMTLQQSILVPGFVIELRTYTADGRRTHSFAKRIPCRPDDYSATFADEIWLYDGEQIGSVGECGGTPQPPPPPPPPQLTCSTDVRLVDGARTQAGVFVACSEGIGADVRVYNSDNGNLLCSNNRFYATPGQASACSFARNPEYKVAYLVEIRTADGQLLTRRDLLPKDATYRHAPRGSYSHGLSIVAEKKRKLLGRGFYWPVTISAQVTDSDVDASEGRALIKVELVLVANGAERVLKSTNVNSGSTASFSVEHEYVDPFFGQPKHVGDLDHGLNRLKVRVWDAYQGQSYVDLQDVSVQVNE